MVVVVTVGVCREDEDEDEDEAGPASSCQTPHALIVLIFMPVCQPPSLGP